MVSPSQATGARLDSIVLAVKMTTGIEIKVVKIVIFFVQHLLAIFLFQLIKLYIRSKPPALQTLLDKTHIIMITIFQSVGIVRLPMMIIIHLEIDFGDPQSQIYGLVIQMFYDGALVALTVVTITNMVLIYTPRLLEEVEEDTFVIIVSTIIGLVSATSVLLTWQMDWCLLGHKMLRQLDAPCTSIGPLRRFLSATCVLLTAGFKLSLIWTNNTISEGEKNIFSGKVMLLTILPTVVTLQALREFGASISVMDGAQSVIIPLALAIVIYLNDNLAKFVRNYVRKCCPETKR